MSCRTVVLASVLAVVPVIATAQAPAVEAPGPLRQAAAAALRDDSAVATFWQTRAPRPRRRDPLWNGAAIGAGLGAAGGAFAGSAALPCSECAGFNVPLTFGVIGAGVGAGIGAWLDALRQSPSPAVTRAARRLTVAPVVGKDVTAMVAQVRF